MNLATKRVFLGGGGGQLYTVTDAIQNVRIWQSEICGPRNPTISGFHSLDYSVRWCSLVSARVKTNTHNKCESTYVTVIIVDYCWCEHKVPNNTGTAVGNISFHL